MDKVDYRYLTIFYRCRASIDKGSAGEAVLAYRAIGLLALNVGASADCSMEILTNTLHLHALVKTLRTPSDGAAAKVVAAIDCLANRHLRRCAAPAGRRGISPRPLERDHDYTQHDGQQCGLDRSHVRVDVIAHRPRR
jgi:hypothetical protein